jgi:excisionase family DNA binding protein
MESLGRDWRMLPGDNSMNEEILTIQEVANLLKVAHKTIYTMAQKGDLPAFKVGGLWRFRRQDIDAWISERVGQSSRVSTPSRTADAKK